MGISNFGEMTRLARVARPDICVITNIGVAHIENLGSRDGILRAKTEMFDYMNPEGTIILNGDDDKLRGYVPKKRDRSGLFRAGSVLSLSRRLDPEYGTSRDHCRIHHTVRTI